MPNKRGELSEELGYRVLDVDNYLHKNQGGYIDFIDYPALRLAVSSLPSFILCGVCLGEVLENLDTTLGWNRVHQADARWNVGGRERVCDFPDGVDAAIEMLTENLAMISRDLDEPGRAVRS